MDVKYWKNLPWVDEDFEEYTDEDHSCTIIEFLEGLEDYELILPSCKIDLLQNEEFVLKVAETHGHIVQFSISNKAIAIKAAANWRDTLSHISEELCSDKDVIMSLVKSFGFMLHQVSEPLKSDKDVLIAALEEVETNRIRYDSLDEAEEARWAMLYEETLESMEQSISSEDPEYDFDNKDQIKSAPVNKDMDKYAHNFDGFNRSLTRKIVCELLDDSGLHLSVVKEAVAILTHFDSDGFCGLDLNSRKWESFFMTNKLKASDMRRIEELAVGDSTPKGGFEKHLAAVAGGKGSACTKKEKEWLDYWKSYLESNRCAFIPEIPQTTNRPEPYTIFCEIGDDEGFGEAPKELKRHDNEDYAKIVKSLKEEISILDQEVLSLSTDLNDLYEEMDTLRDKNQSKNAEDMKVILALRQKLLSRGFD